MGDELNLNLRDLENIDGMERKHGINVREVMRRNWHLKHLQIVHVANV